MALGHRRLSIIDVDGGHQPLSNEDGTVWIAYNGEIYNYRQLAERLRARGHRFRTRSDTEVIVHAYEEYGLDFVTHLNGMFALALHDQRRGRVVLARDHFGIKPLFYATTDEGLFFGSEIKSVLVGAGRHATPDPDALTEYLIFRYAAGSRTFFDGVRRLPPAHLAVWEAGALTTQRYWSRPRPAEFTVSPDAVDQDLGVRFDRAVASQLMSEVPLGAFCSGGIDSGLVTAYATAHATEPFNTFSVGFEDPAWDESALALSTARRYHTDHHTVRLRAQDVPGLLPRLLWHHDEPLSHPNSVPLYLLSELARRHVTVVLTGEGADELFCGYPRYQIARARFALRRMPSEALRAAGWVARMTPHRRAQLLGTLLPLPLDLSIVLNSAYVQPALALELTGARLDRVISERMRIAAEELVNGDAAASISAYEMRTYLQCALDRMDRMAMAHGLEGRVPFLDVPLVEWGAALPSRAKISGSTNKVLLKRHARPRLGREVVDGPKSGFGLPLDAWIRSPQWSALLEPLGDANHPMATVLDPAVTRRLVQEHRAGMRDHGEALWQLVNVAGWFEHVAARINAGVPVRGSNSSISVSV